MKTNSVHRLVLCALLSATALAVSFAESLLPLPLPLPGAKIGLANAVVLLAMLLLGKKEALLVLSAKILLSALLFGTPVSLAYACAGGLLSFMVMCLLHERKSISPIGQSAAGAVFHNLGQVLVAILLTRTPRLLLYFTPLALLAVLTGALSGWTAQLCARRLRPVIFKSMHKKR